MLLFLLLLFQTMNFNLSYKYARMLTHPKIHQSLLCRFHNTRANGGPYSPTTRQREVITSLSNEKIKMMKSLQMKKKRDSSNLIILEGFRMINDALMAGITPTQLLLTEEARNSPLYEQFFRLITSQQLNNCMDLISPAAYQQVSDTVNGQGIVGAFQKPTFSRSLLLDQHNSTNSTLTSSSSSKPLILLLDGVQDPGNLGTITRTAFGLGIQAIICHQTCDIWSPKVLRASMGYGLQVPMFETSSWEDIEQLLQRMQSEHQIATHAHSNPLGFTFYLADGSDSGPKEFQAAKDYAVVNYSQPMVLVMGSEATGISDNLMTALQLKLSTRPSSLSSSSPSSSSLLPPIVHTIQKIRIPMQRNVESFNVAVAASIILAEISKQRQQ